MKQLAVVGPTASGKSAVALELARRRPGTELASVDAMQVYRRMDIGTAKPSATERAAVRHHLIDLVDPSDDYSLAEFQRAAGRVVADATDRGVPTLVWVGGTGLYLSAVLDGLTLPGSWPEIRARLELEAEAVGPAALHARLAEVDPLAASRTEPTNTRRIVRALEVIEGSGRPFSSFGPGLSTYPPIDTPVFGLRWDRAVLTRRIEDRVHAMLAAGLLDEVRGLACGPMSATARQALGYKELFDHLEGNVDLREAIATIITRTRQFAVRQERWFRRDPRIRWIDASGGEPGAIADAIEESLGR